MPMESPVMMTCSVIVCTRDRPEQLEQCLTGISKQVLKPIEVIVVDNAPEQAGSEEVARRWGAKYVLEPRLGLSCARNCGAAEAKGTVVAYIDDDASPHSDWLEKLLPVFHDANVIAAAGRTIAPEASTEVVQLCRLIQGAGADRDSFVLDNNHPQWFEIAAFGGISSGSNMVFRREIFRDWQGFDTRLGLPNAGCEENFAFLSLVDRGHRIAYVPDAIVVHPTAYTVEGLRKRRMAGESHAIAYIAFLFFNAPRHRRRLLKFLFDSARGVRREWRPQVDETAPEVGVQPWKLYLARVAGCWLFVRSSIRSSS